MSSLAPSASCLEHFQGFLFTPSNRGEHESTYDHEEGNDDDGEGSGDNGLKSLVPEQLTIDFYVLPFYSRGVCSPHVMIFL